MSFDTRFCLALLRHEDTFEYRGFDWVVEETEKHNYVLRSEYYDKGFPLSVLFMPLNEECSIMKLIDGFSDFRNISMITEDVPYRILSTLCMDYRYKLFLYALVKLPRNIQIKQIRRLRAQEDGLYDELAKYIELYEGSPLLYEEEEQRVKQIKFKRNKKIKKMKGRLK